MICVLYTDGIVLLCFRDGFADGAEAYGAGAGPDAAAGVARLQPAQY